MRSAIGGGGGFRPVSGLATPVNSFAQRAPQQAQADFSRKPKLQTWSDGSQMELRHAPRRKKGTSLKTSAPCTPAAIPTHWKGKITPAGERERPPQKDEIPDFGTWKKERRKEVRVTGAQRAGDTPVPVMSAVPATPGLLPLASSGRRHGSSSATGSAFAQVVKAPEVGAITPAGELAGEATPVVPRMQGEMPFPGGEATPRLQQQGDATPFLPVPGDAATIGRGGETPRLPGEVTPVMPGAGDRNTSKVAGEETPHAAAQAGAQGGGMTPFVGETSGEATPWMPPRSAAGSQSLYGVTPNVSGEETPLVNNMASAQGFAASGGAPPGDATPMLASKEEPMGAAPSHPQPGFMTPQVAAA